MHRPVMQLGLRPSYLAQAVMMIQKTTGLTDKEATEVLDALSNGKPVILQGVPAAERARLVAWLRDAAYLWQA